MASARSTESMARTTPAQKPRGEHSTTFSAGFCGIPESKSLKTAPKFRRHDPRHGVRRPALSSRAGCMTGGKTLYSRHFPIIIDDPASPDGRAKLRRRFAMATAAPLMPKATAVWLLDNTALSFDQIAEFCKLHPLEVKAIADGDAAQGIKGMDPIATGQLSREEIEKAVADPSHRLKLADPKVRLPEAKKKKGPRYTPVSRRQDRPNAILWLVRNHPELKDSQIMRLVGTTKSTIQAIRERTHWNASNLQPMDPVTL